MRVEDFLIIAIIVLILLGAIWMERLDLACPAGPYTTDKSICKDGNGKGLYQSQASPGDPTQVIIQKLQTAGDAITGRINWRASFIMAVLTSILFNLLFFPTLEWQRLGISIVVLFIAFLGITMFNQAHYYGHIETNIDANLNNLRKNLNIPS